MPCPRRLGSPGAGAGEQGPQGSAGGGRQARAAATAPPPHPPSEAIPPHPLPPPSGRGGLPAGGGEWHRLITGGGYAHTLHSGGGSAPAPIALAPRHHPFQPGARPWELYVLRLKKKFISPPSPIFHLGHHRETRLHPPPQSHFTLGPGGMEPPISITDPNNPRSRHGALAPRQGECTF